MPIPMLKKFLFKKILVGLQGRIKIRPPADPKGPPLVLLRNPVLADQA